MSKLETNHPSVFTFLEWCAATLIVTLAIMLGALIEDAHAHTSSHRSGSHHSRSHTSHHETEHHSFDD